MRKKGHHTVQGRDEVNLHVNLAGGNGWDGG